MNGAKKIIERVKSVASKFHGKNTEEYINPVRHWILGLLFATITLIGGVLYIVADFRAQFNTESDTAPVAKPVIYREKDVQEYAERYREKEEIFNELRKNRQYVIPVTEEAKDEVSQDENDVETPLAEVQLAQ